MRARCQTKIAGLCGVGLVQLLSHLNLRPGTMAYTSSYICLPQIGVFSIASGGDEGFDSPRWLTWSSYLARHSRPWDRHRCRLQSLSGWQDGGMIPHRGSTPACRENIREKTAVLLGY